MQYRSAPSRVSLFSLLVLLALPLWAQTGKNSTDTDAAKLGAASNGAASNGAASSVAGIQTNARDGVFAEPQTLWFSLAFAVASDGSSVPAASATRDEELRLYLDSEEVYRGPGPASIELDVVPGSERFFDIRAERRKRFGEGLPEGTAYWSILIDRAAPNPPRLSVETLAGEAKRLRVDQQSGVRIMALLDAPGYSCEPMLLPEELVIDSGRFHLIAWAVDGAGNESLQVQHSEDAPRLEIVSPVPGLWANRQLLYIESEGFSQIRYTTDGSDPLLEGGLSYKDPVRIERTGIVFLRVAARRQDGSNIRREVRFGVRERGEDLLKPFGDAEFAPQGMRSISLPEGFSGAWAASLPLLNDMLPTNPRHTVFGSGRTISLPQSSSFFRREPLVICDGSTFWRYVVPLGGRGFDAGMPREDGLVRVALGEDFALLSSSRLRAVVREGDEAGFFWRFTPAGKSATEHWQRARRVLPLSNEEGVFEWLLPAETPDSLHSYALAALSDSATLPLAIAARPPESRDPLALVLQEGSEARVLSLRLASRGPGDRREQRHSLYLEAGVPLSIEAAEGEELVASLMDSMGREIGSWILDKRAPPPPVLSAPAQGSVSDEALSFRIASDWPLVGSFRVEREELDGLVQREERAVVPGVHRIDPDTRSPLVVHLDFAARDPSGNESARVVRSFGIDASTIYLDTGAGSGASSASPEGSRMRPCGSLAEALALAARRGLRRIAVRGDIVLDDPLDLSAPGIVGAPGIADPGRVKSGVFAPGASSFGERPLEGPRADLSYEQPILIEGGFVDAWVKSPQPSRIELAEGSSLSLRGRAVFLRDLHLLRPDISGKPLVDLGAGARLSLLRTRLDADGLLVRAEEADLFARFSLFSSRARAFEMRLSGLDLEDSLVSIDIESETDTPPAISLEGGSLRAERMQLSVASSRFATGLALLGSDALLSSCGLRIDAAEFVTALEVQAGRLSVLEGEIEARARDVVLVSLEDADTRFRMARLRSVADGVSRAFQVRGRFPRVEGSRLEHGGASIHSELFAGEEPVAGSLNDNLFVSWQFLWRDLLADGDLSVFNKRYGSVDVSAGGKNRVENKILRDTGDMELLRP